jgi:hypothetical protein
MKFSAPGPRSADPAHDQLIQDHEQLIQPDVPIWNRPLEKDQSKLCNFSAPGPRSADPAPRANGRDQRIPFHHQQT